MHLFDVDVKGHVAVKESEDYQRGLKPCVKNFLDWKIGLSICYDLRFSELYSYYASKQVDLIVVPSAFLVPTGRAHWHVLLRARAIECQAYVVAPAQCGAHMGLNKDKRYSFGHSLIIDPWGEIVCEAGGAIPEVLQADLDKASILRVREQIPMQQHRHFRP